MAIIERRNKFGMLTSLEVSGEDAIEFRTIDKEAAAKRDAHLKYIREHLIVKNNPDGSVEITWLE